jgi:hypothetical protein
MDVATTSDLRLGLELDLAPPDPACNSHRS